MTIKKMNQESNEGLKPSIPIPFIKLITLSASKNRKANSKTRKEKKRKERMKAAIDKIHFFKAKSS